MSTDVTLADLAPPRLIEPDPKEIILCVYEPTLDGFAAAWVVRKAFKEREIPVEFAQHPIAAVDQVAVAGRNVLWMADDVHGSDVGGARSLLFISRRSDQTSLPAPLPFKDWERVFPYGVKTTAKEPGKTSVLAGASLTGLAWDFFFVGGKRPFVVDQVDDRVAGTKKFRDSADTYACVDSYPQNFTTFDRLVEVGEDRKRREFLIAGGQAINRMFSKLAGKTIRVETEQ
jgi:hypothetical protein